MISLCKKHDKTNDKTALLQCVDQEEVRKIDKSFWDDFWGGQQWRIPVNGEKHEISISPLLSHFIVRLQMIQKVEYITH